MTVSFQSHEGHTDLGELTDKEVEAKFAELTSRGFRAFADDIGPMKTFTEIPQETQELYFIGPLVGG